jgi:gamma-glutamylcyclotransferase (GGCT)/AIG2-like uncharacterized protein YtfP
MASPDARNPTNAPSAETLRLFVYDSLLSGERDHALLAGGTLVGTARTRAAYTLIELGPYGALVLEGATSVAGEVYAIDKRLRFALDLKKQYPALFQRAIIELDDGSSAETYVMREDQVRGRRRIKNGSWRERFAARATGR